MAARRDDWFRSTTWSEGDQTNFWARLARARQANRAQYLRIQAETLATTRSPRLRLYAIELFGRLVREYPTDKVQIAIAYHARAQTQELIGNTPAAVADYRRAVAFEREFPHVKTRSKIDLATLIVRAHMEESFPEALELVVAHEAEGSIPFPIDRFIAAAVRAFIAAHRGDDREAAAQAEVALAAADSSHSGLSRHPGIGLVGQQYSTEIKALKRMLSELA